MRSKRIFRARCNLFKFSWISARIPKEVATVLVLRHGLSYPICPRCDSTIEREYMCYCDRCGQHLSWRKFDKAAIIHAPRNKK